MYRPSTTWRAPAPSAAPLVLSVGRVAAHKRPHLLVDALALLRRDIPTARLVLAGDARGPSHAPVLAQVRERAVVLGVAGAVHCAGLVDDGLLEHLYARADLLVSASAHEGFCIPVVEAMARGVPVVAMAAGALPETLDAAGLLVPSGDVPALAAAMLNLLSDLDRRVRLVERGYEHARRYRPAAVAEQLLALLQHLPPPRARRVTLPRLGQYVDLSGLDAAAEVAIPLPRASEGIPVFSTVAAKLRGWLTFDLQQQLDVLIQHQVAYNRQIAQALRMVDELSATISEQQAAQQSDETS